MLPCGRLFHCTEKKKSYGAKSGSPGGMLHSSESKIRQTLLNRLSVANQSIVEMQHDSPFMCPSALSTTNFGQRARHTFSEVCTVHLLSLWKNRDFVLPCAIEENREHSFLIDM
jgi:hypothetical protein